MYIHKHTPHLVHLEGMVSAAVGQMNNLGAKDLQDVTA